MQSVSGLDNAEGNAGSEHVTTKKNDKVDRIFLGYLRVIMGFL